MDNVPLRVHRLVDDIIYYTLWVIEGVLLLRFLLKIFGANPQNQIVDFIYSLSSVLIAPFRNIFDPFLVQGILFEPSILIALICYAVIAPVLIFFVGMLGRQSF